jgi:hypothetical protein
MSLVTLAAPMPNSRTNLNITQWHSVDQQKTLSTQVPLILSVQRIRGHEATSFTPTHNCVGSIYPTYTPRTDQFIKPVLLHNLRRRVSWSYLWYTSRRRRRHVRMLCNTLKIFFGDISNLATTSFSFPQHIFFVSSYCLKRNLLNVFSLISKLSSRAHQPHPGNFLQSSRHSVWNSI